jgi:rhamnogalacturonyl hydrolase YesR
MNRIHTIRRAAAAAILAPVISGSCLSAENPTAQPPDSPRHVGKRLVENFLARDYWYMGAHGLAYPEACAAIGALDYARLTDDKPLIEKIAARYRRFLTGEDPKILPRHMHVDISVSGALLLRIYRCTGEEAFLKEGLTAYADKTWAKPNKDNLTPLVRWWIDDMYMLTILQAEAFRATDDPKYADRVARLMAAYIEKLQQPDGLFHHADNVPIRWARGNGWTAAGMAEALDVVPANHPDRKAILAGYRRMMKTLLDCQAESGLWKQVLDHPEFWDETSGSAMFAFAMARGIRRGWLGDDPRYQQAVEKAWRGLVAQLDENANLKLVCVGTNKKNSLDHYMQRPKATGDLHGQAPLLWLANELLQKK